MPNISVAEYNRLTKAVKKLEEIKLRESLMSFVESFKENMGISLAVTPYDEWPQFAQNHLVWTARKSRNFQDLARIYKDRLPKREDFAPKP